MAAARLALELPGSISPYFFKKHLLSWGYIHSFIHWRSLWNLRKTLTGTNAVLPLLPALPICILICEASGIVILVCVGLYLQCCLWSPLCWKLCNLYLYKNVGSVKFLHQIEIRMEICRVNCNMWMKFRSEHPTWKKSIMYVGLPLHNNMNSFLSEIKKCSLKWNFNDIHSSLK